MTLKIARLKNRAVLHLTGPDTRTYLQGLITNNALAVSPTHPIWAGLLTPQGKYLFDFLVFDDGAGGLFLDAEAGRLSDLIRRLTLYRLRAKVEITPRPDLAVFAAWGSDTLLEDHPHDPRLPALGQRWIIPTASISEREGPIRDSDLTARGPDGPAADIPTCDEAHYEAHRLALGVPEGSADISVDKMLWLECNAAELSGVDFKKGCYVGQENTARMFHRSKVRKRLLIVRFAGDVGDGVLYANGVSAGEIRSHQNGLGLALLKLEPVEAGLPFTLNSQSATIEVPPYLDLAQDAAFSA